jgi:hypothetical protein
LGTRAKELAFGLKTGEFSLKFRSEFGEFSEGAIEKLFGKCM